MKVDVVHNIPNQDSLDSEWIIWHKAMKARYGKKQANLLFLKAWAKRNTDGLLVDGKANTVTMRDYLKEQGINVERGYLSYVADAIDDTQDFFAGIFGTATTAAMVAGAIVFILLVWIIIRIVRKPQDYSQLITAIALRK